MIGGPAQVSQAHTHTFVFIDNASVGYAVIRHRRAKIARSFHVCECDQPKKNEE